MYQNACSFCLHDNVDNVPPERSPALRHTLYHVTVSTRQCCFNLHVLALPPYRAVAFKIGINVSICEQIQLPC